MPRVFVSTDWCKFWCSAIKNHRWPRQGTALSATSPPLRRSNRYLHFGDATSDIAAEAKETRKNCMCFFAFQQDVFTTSPNTSASKKMLCRCIFGTSQVGVPRHKVGWANGLYFQAGIGTLKSLPTNNSRGVDGGGDTPPEQKKREKWELDWDIAWTLEIDDNKDLKFMNHSNDSWSWQCYW